MEFIFFQFPRCRFWFASFGVPTNRKTILSVSSMQYSCGYHSWKFQYDLRIPVSERSQIASCSCRRRWPNWAKGLVLPCHILAHWCPAQNKEACLKMLSLPSAELATCKCCSSVWLWHASSLQTSLNFVRSEVYTAVTMKNSVFWDKKPVRPSQETHYISATEPSWLMLCKIWGFHVDDYEECRLLW
jgi:hypothetical protein